MSTVITVQDVSKLYRLGVVTSKTVAQDFNKLISRILGKENPELKIGEVNDRAKKTDGQFVWALNNVSFDVEKGEVLAIIGKNGAGKSTLLKILSRVTLPTKGNIRIKGRVASLLEVGTGFHQELTGRENIFLNGSILGMTKSEIKKKFDEIVDFSGIGSYIDTPVKRYSSGMFVRLAFAVAAHLEPEILIVDEVLAVGDAEFQKRCIGKMQDVSKKEGRTVLFVSHNMAAVKNLCTKGIILEHGMVVYKGDVESSVNKYLSSGLAVEETDLTKRTDRAGDQRLKFVSIDVQNDDGESVSQVISGEPARIELKYECTERLEGNLIVSVSFMDVFGNVKSIFVTDEMGVKFQNVDLRGTIHLRIPRLLLRADSYLIKIFASLNTTRVGDVLDSVENAAGLSVLPGDFWKSGKINRTGNYGLMDGDYSIEYAVN